ncbi:gamma-glutamyltransferase [Cyanobacterium aponinum AL20118]|uniref:Glutathione hydrolase proenzyme n=2 Tax=Cyanobacterium aponinum TaxID=379064 RepID=A0A844GVW2_9CHRO|nr:gamma-glutamyltransferase [Cyanobacterium aponinum]MTF38345.1 gamma-glutamyltransferase [Cyanobacterium aponinum 0216]WPF87912.1 gamma-glutamyltransferase [Cyanobacterium aponinum AL20115]
MIASLKKYIWLICLICVFVIGVESNLAQTPIYDTESIFHPVTARSGMVSSQEKLATQAGLEVLQQGGNAVDAAVTVGFALAVTLPRAGNIGGGGFMMIHFADNNQNIALDYREKAPLKATKNMFLDDKGEVDSNKSRFSHLAVGVPGTVAGLTFALEKYGTISLKRALQPAIELAEKGFPVTQDFYDSLLFSRPYLERNPASQEIYFPNGNPPPIGSTFQQPQLAKTLKLIAKDGKKAFYEGEIARNIVQEMSKNGGLITLEDLMSYEPKIRQPIQGEYLGYQIYSMPPPSSGGVHLIQMLNILKGFDLKNLGHNTADTIHLMAETMKLAYADRSLYLGDPDFVDVPIQGLISQEYADFLREKIDKNQAIPSNKIKPNNPFNFRESHETTHYSIVDQYGNAVANTYTLNFSYGTGITVPNSGFLLNNEMDDFVAKPNTPNAYGLTGGEYNAIAPEKRMLSSMTPTIITKDGEVFLVTGSPGGSRIITTVLQIIINVLEFNLNIAEATVSPRFHHQWLPDELLLEKGINQDTRQILAKKGHNLKDSRAMGSTQSIMKQDKFLYGFSDPRRREALTLGF